MKRYTTYVFKDVDPILEELEGVVFNSRLTYKEISECGVSKSTLYAWFRKGKTKRPQFATISAVALACGAEGVKFVNGKPVFLMPRQSNRIKVVK
jgi:DNA-binding phage protein